MAYELADLKAEIIKAGGAEVTEAAAKAIVEGVLEWVIKESKESENTYDDLVAGFLVPFKGILLQQLDKVDEFIKE